MMVDLLCFFNLLDEAQSNSGKTKDIRFASSDKVEIVQSDRQKLEFSYHDQTGYHFMDTTTYDTITFQEEFVEDSKDLLIDGLEVEVLFGLGELRLEAIVGQDVGRDRV